jgi:hypothetical protein
MLNRTTAVLCGLVLMIGCNRLREAAPAKTGATTRATPSDARNAKIDTVIHPLPQFIDQSILGADLGADGKVKTESDTFRAGQPIYLTMVLRESPPGLQTRAQWRDAKEKVLYADQKNMNGAKVVTFTLKETKLKPGPYHVVGYWGGNIAADKKFEIVGAGSKRKK